MTEISRRGFLGALGASAAAFAVACELDPDLALWVPGQKTIFIPNTVALATPSEQAQLGGPVNFGSEIQVGWPDGYTSTVEGEGSLAAYGGFNGFKKAMEAQGASVYAGPEWNGRIVKPRPIDALGRTRQREFQRHLTAHRQGLWARG